MCEFNHLHHIVHHSLNLTDWDTFKVDFTYLIAPNKKKEGEECGSCFSPSNNFHCGTCEDGLECIKDPMIADAPGMCRIKSGSFTMN